MSIEAGQVWWLYGPPSCSPAPADDPGRYALKARAAGRVVRRFTDAGARTVIVSGVVDERSLSTVVDEVDGADVTFCRLRVDPGALKRRLSTRYGPDDTARALAEADRWGQYDAAGVLVDTGAGDPLDIARWVAEAVRSAAPPTPMPSSRPPAEAPADEIVAGCVADLREQFRAVGAQDLVLTGRVEQAADVQHYRDAPGVTPLVACRLHTSAEALRERILARTRGGGPMLAGDALIGLTADKVEPVVHDALLQQSRLEQADLADISLETAEKSAEAATQSARAAFDRLAGTAPEASTPNPT